MISEKDLNVEGSPKYWMESYCWPSTVKFAIWNLEEMKKKYPPFLQSGSNWVSPFFWEK